MVTLWLHFYLRCSELHYVLLILRAGELGGAPSLPRWRGAYNIFPMIANDVKIVLDVTSRGRWTTILEPSDEGPGPEIASSRRFNAIFIRSFRASLSY